MFFTDTHTHLYSSEFAKDWKETIRRAITAGVERFYLPNIDSSSIASMFALEKEFPANCFPMMGLHPCSVDQRYGDELVVVEHWLTKRKFSAIGEIGMDYYHDATFIPQQKDAFRRQIGLALKYDLPIVIHQRDCFNDLFAIVSEHCIPELQQKSRPPLRGIFHCFTGTLEQAEQVIGLGGFKLGIGGVLTYKNSALPDVIRQIDIKHIVLETDSPYLPPVPHRGKRNESSYLLLTAQKLAEIKGISLEEVAKITTANARQIFGN